MLSAKHGCPVIAEDEFERLKAVDAPTTRSATKRQAKE
jgi:hypothetical protein